MNKYKILIFDLDDTLIDNIENIKYAFQKMIAEQNEKYSEEKFNRWYKIDNNFWNSMQDGLIEIPEHLKNETGKKSQEFINWVRAQRVLIYFNNRIDLEEAIRLNHIYVNALTEMVIAIKDAYETLKYLSMKYHIIIATNGPYAATKDKLLKINCLDFVKEIFSADMIGHMKPGQEFFEAIQNELNNYNNEEFFIIGDSLKSDVGFAMNCNFDSCWFNKNNDSLIENYKPTVIINNLLDLKEIL